jgi:hypothetical protein
MPRIGRSRVREAMLQPQEAPGFTRPLTEIITKDINKKCFLPVKRRPERKNGNITAICQPIF